MSESQAKEFLPIRISTLRGDLKISFNAYVYVAGKYILYCRHGDSFDGRRLKRLRKKKLKKLYITSDDEKPYRNYIVQSIESAYDPKSKKPLSVRAEVIQGSQQAATEQLMESPEDEQSYKEAKESSSRYVEFLRKEAFSLKAILDIPNPDMNLAHHSVTVASLAVGIAEKLEQTKEVPMDILTLGCFLHDIEHHYSHVDYTKVVEEMDSNEKKLYKNHPLKGANRVKDLQHFDKEVIDIIHQHEEYADGSGFPQGLMAHQMSPSVLITGTANTFDRYMSFRKIPVKQALKEMLINYMALHPLEYLRALQSVLKDKGII